MTARALIERRVRGLGSSSVTDLLDVATDRGWLSPRTTRLVKAVAVPVVVVVALLWVAVAVLRSGGLPQPHVYAEFVDPARGSYVDVQLDRSASSYGTFSAMLPGEGRVWPKARVSATTGSGSVTLLRYDGVGYRDPNRHAGVDPTGPPAPGAMPIQVVPLRLAAQVDTAAHTAVVDVWVDGVHHRVGPAGQPGGADSVASDFLTGVRMGDWEGVYALESAAMRNGSKLREFSSAMSGAGGASRITRAVATGPLTHTRTDAGVSYAQVPVALAYRSDQGTTSMHATLVLVVDGGSWKVLSLE